MSRSILDLLERPDVIARGLPRLSVTALIRRNTVVLPESGCWLWTGSISNSGYAHLTFRRGGHPPATLDAHRVSYEVHHGRVPAGLVIDHLCGLPPCVNPSHLEPVTQRENLRRSPAAPAGVNAAKTQCDHGHIFTAENTYRNPSTGNRSCRICGRDWMRKYRAARAESSAKDPA